MLNFLFFCDVAFFFLFWINFLLKNVRADVWNYGESGVSREISHFFTFCPGNLYSKVFSKITFKVSTAFHFVQNRAKFENKAYRPPSSSGICAK